MTIAEMLARNARIYPDESALIELKPSQKIRREITWRVFDERANRIANALAARGVGKGDKVLHLMLNSTNWLEAYFGIIRTGAWAVPLNFRFTSSDIKYCADIAEAKVMILGQEFAERVEAIRPQLPTIKDYIFVGENTPQDMESFEDIIDKASPQPLQVALTAEDECGLYFTSGTTGDPKPIMLTHKNMECAAVTEAKHHYLQHDDNFIIIPPFYHTGSKMHWFGSLLVGGRATILTEMSPKYIFEAVHHERGTIVFLLVPWAQDILGALDRGELKQKDYDLSSWRLMHMGAQPIPPSLIKRWKQRFPNMQYDTSYGLSEATGPGCVDLRIENNHKLEATGKAGFNWEVRIVDDKGQDVGCGEVGELIVKGDGVMKGYYKNPQKTAETLRDGWLYTGDMAKMDEDGFIYIVDRKKDVIITGGENIFPVEVENIIRHHPKVHDVGVIGLPDERLGEIACAVITPRDGDTLTEEEINEFCEQNLPRYKRPRRIIFDRVPRNPTGKIEKPKMRQKYSGIKESFKL
ncbi:MAG: AMP-binding protein [Dehalococcoidales bacterium]|nr:AMP-binding protein [Dehalococcoidales bacterium]